MLAYLFWHVPRPDVPRIEYDKALVAFYRDLAADPPSGMTACSTYHVDSLPWLGQAGYEDWCLLESSAALDALNAAAVRPQRWNVHAQVATRMESGYGGLYNHLAGEHNPLRGTRAIWLKRPRGIRFEEPLRAMASAANGWTSVWRRQMVLGPGHEFLVVGDAGLRIEPPPGWSAIAVTRDRLVTP